MAYSWFIAIVLFVASFTAATAGFGFALVSMPLITLVVSPRFAVPFVMGMRPSSTLGLSGRVCQWNPPRGNRHEWSAVADLSNLQQMGENPDQGNPPILLFYHGVLFPFRPCAHKGVDPLRIAIQPALSARSCPGGSYGILPFQEAELGTFQQDLALLVACRRAAPHFCIGRPYPPSLCPGISAFEPGPQQPGVIYPHSIVGCGGVVAGDPILRDQNRGERLAVLEKE